MPRALLNTLPLQTHCNIFPGRLLLLLKRQSHSEATRPDSAPSPSLRACDANTSVLLSEMRTRPSAIVVLAVERVRRTLTPLPSTDQMGMSVCTQLTRLGSLLGKKNPLLMRGKSFCPPTSVWPGEPPRSSPVGQREASKHGAASCRGRPCCPRV